MSEFFTWLFATLRENAFASGGLIVLFTGAALALLRSVPLRIWSFIRQRVILTLTVTDEDDPYVWLEAWLIRQRMAQRTKNLRLWSRWEPDPKRPNTTLKRTIIAPGDGDHLVRYKNALIWVQLGREKLQAQTLTQRSYTASVTLRMFNGSRALLEEILTQAERDHASATKNNFISVYGQLWDSWSMLCARPRRASASLVLAAGVREGIVDDAKKFRAREDWYRERGIPYRRGYLLYGPPGNGKSSLAVLLASELKQDVYVLSLGNPSLNDTLLHRLMASLPADAILCLEDVDAAFTGRTSESDNKLTFSGVLNALDGITATEGRILLMTTNHLDRLDAALIRPGRVDVRLEIGNANYDQASRLFRRFFPNTPDHVAHTFAGAAGTGEHCMAALQEHLVRHEDPASAAVFAVPTLRLTA